MSTYTPIASVTLSSAQSDVTFSGIPQTYTDLVVVANIKGDTGNVGLNYQFNSDTASNYSSTVLAGDGTSASSDRYSNQTSAFFTSNYGAGTNDWVTVISNIQNYANTTTNKTVLTRWSKGTGQLTAAVALWRKTPEAINTIKISALGVNFASGSTFNLYGVSANDAVTPKATGGNQVYSDGTYWYHIYSSSGTFTPSTSLNADYVVVAGGGGGGRRWDSNEPGGGGGGAGGFRTSIGGTALSLLKTSYTVTVGAGGSGGNTGNPGNGYKGSNSVFSTISATGGGYGGGYLNSGGTGGSAGGHGRDRTAAVTPGNEGGYSPVEGYAGGRCTSGGNGTGCGGGGGAGGAGNDGNSSNAGAGGIGTYNAITNATKIGQLSSGNYYVAGGGGGTYASGGGGGTGASGGLGGGGAGANNYNSTAGVGTANTGGGGGGGGGSSTVTVGLGGNGGSGVVIVRYAV
jgi:hypothetical protein